MLRLRKKINIVTPAEIINDVGKEMEIWRSGVEQKVSLGQILGMVGGLSRDQASGSRPPLNGAVRSDAFQQLAPQQLVEIDKRKFCPELQPSEAEARRLFLGAMTDFGRERREGKGLDLLQLLDEYEAIWRRIFGDSMAGAPFPSEVKRALGIGWKPPSPDLSRAELKAVAKARAVREAMEIKAEREARETKEEREARLKKEEKRARENARRRAKLASETEGEREARLEKRRARAKERKEQEARFRIAWGNAWQEIAYPYPHPRSTLAKSERLARSKTA